MMRRIGIASGRLGFIGLVFLGFVPFKGWALSPSPSPPTNSASWSSSIDSAPANSTGEKFRPFSDTAFSLAYEVFLAARNVHDAFELSTEAVRQRPDLMDWHQRLARTAEWVGQPTLAQKEWAYLGKATHSASAYREAIRLAGLLRNPQAALPAWEGLAKVTELDLSEWQQWLDAYESSGEPGPCVNRLREHLASHSDPKLFMRLAEILMRSDRDEEALETLSQMANRYGNTPEICLRRAEICCRRGQLRQAASILDSAPVPSRDHLASDSVAVLLLRLKASVYSWMQRDADALNAYRSLFAAGNYNSEDLRTISLIARQRDPDLAIRVAMAGWLQFHEPDHLIYYLERCLEVDRWDLASHVLKRLTPEQWSQCAEASYFYVLVARIHQREGKTTLARSEYHQALAHDPGIEEYQAGYLWLLIEQGRLSELSAYADELSQGPATPKALLEPLAMAYKLLQRHRLALAYYRMLAGDGESMSFPFLMNYAELLEQSGDGRGAERAYDRAQKVLLRPESQGENREGKEWQESLLRWSKRFGNSDSTDHRLAALSQENHGGGGAKEWAFSWRVERGQNPDEALAALGAQEKTFPAWAQLAVAMRKQDLDKVHQLLANRESGLGDDDRAQAAAFLGLRKEAAEYATRGGLEGSMVPEPMGLPAKRGLPGLGGEFAVKNHPFYQEQITSGQVHATLGTGTLISAAAETRRRPWISKDLNFLVPDRADAARLELRYVTQHSESQLSTGWRSSSAASVGGYPKPIQTWAMAMGWRPISEIEITGQYEHNDLAEENPILALIGLKNGAQIGAQFNLPAETKWEWSLAHLTFHAWDGRNLGKGSSIATILSHRIFDFLSSGINLGYHDFSAAGLSSGPQGLPLIGGLLAQGEFPQSFWHGSVYAEWINRSSSHHLGSLSPTVSMEVGRNYFPAASGQPVISTNEWAVRAGFGLYLGSSHRLTLLGDYARGLQGRQEIETGLSLHYDHTIR